MKFMMLMFMDFPAWNRLSKAEQDAAVGNLMQFSEELRAAGKLVLTQGLAPSTEAVSIRKGNNGSRIVTDGPFTETKEAAGGYYVIECASREEAVEWGKKLPLATWGVEIRRISFE